MSRSLVDFERPRRPPAWRGSWFALVCEWRRWRRMGFSRWASFSIILSSLHRLH